MRFGTIRLLLLLSLAAPLARAQDSQSVPVLMGYLTASPSASLLMVDNRPVRFNQATDFSCGSTETQMSPSGMPVIVPGTELAVYGKWNKKQSSFTATSVCGLSAPARKINGSAVIDEVVPSSAGVTLIADGRVLRLRAKQGILNIEPPLKSDLAPTAGEWLDYQATRQTDGSYLIKAADLREPRFGPDDKHIWKPIAFVAPSAQGPGKFQPAHLFGTWKLPYDPQALARLQRVGDSVIPKWEKSLPSDAPDKWPIAFYVLKGGALADEDCLSFPNGTILVLQKTLARLKQDDQLAALLAGCVGEVLEEQDLRQMPKMTKAGVVEAASMAVPPVAASGALIGAFVYADHVENDIQAQSARVQLTYLAMAKYSASNGPAAWETLKGKNDLPRWDKQPPGRALRLYKAEAENTAAASEVLTAAGPH